MDDIDIFTANAENRGYQCESQTYAGIRGFVSLRRENKNLIVTADPEFYERFVGATTTAKALGLTRKADRITLFQALLYGNYPYEHLTP